MQTYTTLDRRVLNLSDLKKAEGDFFDRCYSAYQEDTDWDEFSNLVASADNPLLQATSGRITQAVWDHPLFQAIRDLEDRLGIKQGRVDAERGDDLATDPLADEFIPATEAARRKKVTLPGLHKAIDRGDVIAAPARPKGTWLLVSLNSLRRWKPNRVRQAARKQQALAPNVKR